MGSLLCSDRFDMMSTNMTYNNQDVQGGGMTNGFNNGEMFPANPGFSGQNSMMTPIHQNFGPGDYRMMNVPGRRKFYQDCEDFAISHRAISRDFAEYFVSDPLISRMALQGSSRDAIIRDGGAGKAKAFSAALTRLASALPADADWVGIRACAAREVNNNKGKAKAYAVIVPNRVAFAPDNPDRDEWDKALEKELNGLIPSTLKAVPISEVGSGDELLPALVILTKKPDGTFKARIVACGNFQKLQSNEVYSGVVGHDVWLQSIILGLRLGWNVAQIDISQAFLQTEKEDDVERPRTFLRIPSWVNGPKDEVWEVLKSIYGLRSAPASWQATLSKALRSWGFKRHPLDDSVWQGTNGEIVMIYVDDLIVIAPRNASNRILELIKNRFTATPPVHLLVATPENPFTFLGHEIWFDKESGSLIVSQAAYARLLTERFDVKSGLSTLHREDYSFDPDNNESPRLSPKDQTVYRSKIGGLAYLAHATRPDLLAPVSMLAEFQSCSTEQHMKSVDKLLRYVLHTADRVLKIPIVFFEKGASRNVIVKGSFDANFLPSRARCGGIVFLCHLVLV